MNDVIYLVHENKLFGRRKRYVQALSPSTAVQLSGLAGWVTVVHGETGYKRKFLVLHDSQKVIRSADKRVQHLW